ncbi:MAG: ABC transporter ATP-binding protein [Acidobacteria bacterium]|nr:ABC transporter ATP-binding protein [Acidobacteriota bacterium]
MSVALDSVVVAYGDVIAVDHVSLGIQPRKLTALLGPSGCGKTSLLRAIAGLEPIAAGSIRIGDRLIAGDGVAVPPEKRHVGLVFQQGALFPHMTVWKNVLFGLRGVAEREARAEEALRLVQMWDLRHRHPDEISGGEQQRVALARAIAPSPDVVLFDEPFANLDAALRLKIREEVRSILTRAGITAVLVTHDQEEALSIADVVAVMDGGRILQVGSPATIYRQPASRQVADFVGENQTVECSVTSGRVETPLGELRSEAPSGPAALLVRPEEIEVISEQATAGARATLLERRFFGHDVLDRVKLEDGNVLQVRRHPEDSCEPGNIVRLQLRPGEFTLFSGDGAIYRAHAQ